MGHGVGVVGRLGDGLSQQLDGADRRLELVADVGDEVAPDHVEALRGRAVLGQHQHEPGRQRRDARVHLQGSRAADRHLDVDLADLTVAAHLADEVDELRRMQVALTDDAQRHGRGRGLADLVVDVDDDRRGRQHTQHGVGAERHEGCLDDLRLVTAPLVGPPDEGDEGTEHEPDGTRQHPGDFCVHIRDRTVPFTSRSLSDP